MGSHAADGIAGRVSGGGVAGPGEQAEAPDAAEGHLGQIDDQMGRILIESVVQRAVCRVGRVHRSTSPATRSTMISPGAQPNDSVAQDRRHRGVDKAEGDLGFSGVIWRQISTAHPPTAGIERRRGLGLRHRGYSRSDKT